MKVAQNVHELSDVEREKALAEIAGRNPGLARATLEALLEIENEDVHGPDSRKNAEEKGDYEEARRR